jgi:hypothetical protein
VVIVVDGCHTPFRFKDSGRRDAPAMARAQTTVAFLGWLAGVRWWLRSGVIVTGRTVKQSNER